MNFHCQKILKSERFNLLKPDWTSACRFSELSSFQTKCLALPRFAKSRVSHFHVGQTESNHHSIARKTRGLNVYRMFVITAGIHNTGQSLLIILKKKYPGCSLRQSMFLFATAARGAGAVEKMAAVTWPPASLNNRYFSRLCSTWCWRKVSSKHKLALVHCK